MTQKSKKFFGLILSGCGQSKKLSVVVRFLAEINMWEQYEKYEKTAHTEARKKDEKKGKKEVDKGE